MKKIYIWIVGIVVVIGIVIAVSKSTTTDSHIIKIGVVAPLTGGATVYGVGLAKGIELAAKDIHGTKYSYKVIVEDDATTPAKSASAAQKLVSVDKVQALITVTSGTGNAVKPIATAAGIPHICVCADTTIADGKYNFTNSTMPMDETAEWIRTAASRGAHSITILSQNQPGINLIIASLKKNASTSAITIAYEDHFDGTTQDFKTIIAKSRQVKSDLVAAVAFPPSLDILGQELKNNAVTNIAGIGTFAIAAHPELFNGKWYSDASLADPAFKERFVAAYPDIRFNVRVAPFGYDSFNLLVNGFERGSSVSEYLLGLTSYPGKAGDVHKNKGESIFHTPIGIWEIRDGKPVQVK